MIVLLVTSVVIFGFSLGVAHLLLGASLRVISEARSRSRWVRSGEPGLTLVARARAPEVSSLGIWRLALEVAAFPPASKRFGSGRLRRSAGSQMVLVEPRNAGEPRQSLAGLMISTG